MKILLALLMLISIVSFSQTWPSSCDATVISERIFRNDVYKLALHRLMQTNNNYKDSIEIPPIHKDSITKILYAFYNLPPSLIKDTIMYYFGFADFDTTSDYNYEFDSCHFHHTYLYNPNIATSVKRVSLGINRNITNAWADDWVAGNFNNTSNSEINELVINYDLKIKVEISSPNYHYVTITTKRALNTNGLAKKLYGIMGGTTVNDAAPYNYIGDGNSIHFDYVSDGVIVTFRNACGDCPAGCTYGRFWKFKVNVFSDCSVTYLKDSIFWVYTPQFNGIYVCDRKGGDIVTPVHFRNVMGEINNEKASLFWDVLTESSIRYYSIEKSFNGNSFFEIGRVNATAQNTPSKTYTWRDVTTLDGSCFFRIKAVENSGEVIYSKAVMLKKSKNNFSVTVFPNPLTNHEMKLQLGGKHGWVKILLYTLDGRLLFSKTVNIEGNFSKINLPITIQSGTYLVKISVLSNPQFEMKHLILIQ